MFSLSLSLYIYIYIYRSEGDAERDISSLGAMGWGVEVARKFFRRRRRRPPQKWVFGDYHVPSFSDT